MTRGVWAEALPGNARAISVRAPQTSDPGLRRDDERCVGGGVPGNARAGLRRMGSVGTGCAAVAAAEPSFVIPANAGIQ